MSNMPVIFTLNFSTNDDQIFKKLNTLDENDKKFTITSLLLNNGISTISDRDYIRGSIISSTTKKNEILNVQFDSNNNKPIFTFDELDKYKNLGIKITFTFNHYIETASNLDIEGKKSLNDIWQELLKKVDYVFFSNEHDQEIAIKQGYINKDKTANLQNVDTKFIVGAFESIANEQPIFSSKTLDAAEIITDKFNIENKDQKFGIRLEVAEIMKDPINGEANLNKYIEQLTEMFAKEASIKDTAAQTNSLDGEKYMPEEKDQKEVTANLFKRITTYFKDIVSSFKAIFSKKEDTPQTIPDSQPTLTTSEITATAPEIAKPLEQTIAPFSSKPPSLIKKEENILKPEYLYTDDDIKNILENSLDKNKVKVQQISLAWPEELRGQVFQELMNEIKTNNKTAIIPIETGGEHWVGLMATYNKQNDEITFTYNDPKGNPIENRDILQKLIKDVAPNSITIDLQTQQQENPYDCGAFVCNNLTRLANGQEILNTEQSKNMGMQLRQQHTGILNQALTKQQAHEIGNQAASALQVGNNKFTDLIQGQRNTDISQRGR